VNGLGGVEYWKHGEIMEFEKGKEKVRV